LRGPQDEEGDEIPEEDCDQNVEQDCRNLFLILGDEIAPAFNNLRVGCPVATPIRDRKKPQQGREDQSTRKEPFEDGGKMLARGSIGHAGEGPPQIEIHQDPRRD